MTAIICLLVGIACGFPLGIAWQRRRSTAPRVAEVAGDADQPHTYGHPRAPVPALRAKLPPAPVGCVWEIKVQYSTTGTPFLHLALIDVSTGEPISETKKDLINGQYWTWAETYRKYTASQSHAREKFDEDFLGPVLDWSVNAVNQRANANASGDYTIG